MNSRSKSRQLALQVLYQADVGIPLDPQGSFELVDESPSEERVRSFAREIARGCLEQRAGIDAVLARCARNWTPARMPVLDRNVMRIGIWELLFGGEISPAVAIDEAVELAKRFGTAESGAFVNGVLDRVAGEREGLRQEFKVAEGSCSRKP